MIIKWTFWRLSQAQTSSDIPHTSKKIFQAESCQIQRNFGDFILSCIFPALVNLFLNWIESLISVRQLLAAVGVDFQLESQILRLF